MTLFLQTGPRRSTGRWILGALGLLLALGIVHPALAAGPADLSGLLRDLALKDAAGTLTAGDPVSRLTGVQAGRVQVDVLFSAPVAGELANLAQLDVRVERQKARRAQVSVPVANLLALACLPNVAQVRLPNRPVLLQIGPTVSEGLQLTNALSLQLSGVTGAGVNVAVIDQGFLGYPGAELPTNVITRSFRADGLVDVQTDHGTAVAEIIADMAPEVTLYLLCISSDLEAEAAVEWCRQNDIDILNMSLGFLMGPFDGTHDLDSSIDRARDAGVLPVVAAGNFAQRHWSGDYADADGDRLGEFDTGDEGMSVVTTAANESLQIYLSWFATASAVGTRADVTDRDYDIELVNSTGVVIARSAYTQNGNDPPSERLFALAPTPGTYQLRIRAVSANIATGPVDHFEFFAYGQDFEQALQVPETSLSAPGEAVGALSIGATRAVTNLPAPAVNYPIDTLEPFSSQGPTTDGRQKPDLCGPNWVSTSTTLSPFPGTSAAAPHVAGGAALLKSEDPSRTADELADVLVRLAGEQNLIEPITLPGGTDATIDEAGAGRLSLRLGLDTKAPTISISFPVNGSTITTAQPTIVGVITDTETGVDTGTIVLSIDGSQVPWDSFNPGSGVVTYTPPTPLSRTAHTVQLEASDIAGNAGTPAVTNFRVGLPTLSAGLHLLSLPYRNLLNTNPASIFGVGLDELTLVRWLPTDTAFSKYRIFPDPLASFEPPDATGDNPTVNSPPAGLGYWVNLPREVILNVAGETLSDVTSYTIKLSFGTAEPTGWNMIGNPFPDAVDWSTVQFVTNGVRQDLDDAIASGVTSGILFEYVPPAGTRPGRYDFTAPQSAVLEPMLGYWLHVNTNTSVIIYPATVVGGAGAPQAAPRAAAPTAGDWKLQLVASAPGMLDTCNYLGVAPTASSGSDVAHDILEPPPLTDTLRLYFPHSDWGAASGQYTQDLRARAAGTQTWPVEVTCPPGTATVTLNWPHVNATVPGDVTLRLQDIDSGRTVFMRTTTSYAFRPGEAGVRHLTVTAERATAGGPQIAALSAAQARDGNVVITYQLLAAAAMSAEIRNIAGRPVRALIADRQTAAGAQVLTWDARNDAGVRVPSGTYLLQLTARAADGQMVRRVLPLNAAR